MNLELEFDNNLNINSNSVNDINNIRLYIENIIDFETFRDEIR